MSKPQGTAKPHTEVCPRSYQQAADVVSPWVGKGFAPVLLNTVFCRARSHPKATSRGEYLISRTLGLEGPRVWLSCFMQASSSGWRCSILETSPLEILPSSQQPEKRLRINKEEVGCPSVGCRHLHLLGKGYRGATDSPENPGTG